VNAEAPSPVHAYLRRPSLIDFPGQLAAVFFISGCNFRCGYCHNAFLAATPLRLTWQRVKDACNAFRDHWVTGAVISGGEPTLSPELPEMVRLLKRFGWAVKLDTNGSRPDVLAALIQDLDYVAMDIKCAPRDYPALTGFDDVRLISDSAAILRHSARNYEFRTTVPSEGFTREAAAGMAALLGPARRYVLQPFIPRNNLPDPRLRSLPRTSPDTMAQFADWCRESAEEVIIR
jgi:pyruvate formate lyase activating enzyme